MDCPKCNKPVIDDAIFCSNCGARIDGNKSCPYCNRLISNESVFCAYCGKRVDGKKICSNCGNEIIGDFCSFCGTSYKSTTLDSNGNRALTKESFPFRLISSLFLLLALLALLGFSFTFGTTISSSTALIKSHNGFSYYLFKCYSELENESFKTLFPYILTTVALSVNLLTTTTSLIYSAIKIYRNYNNKNLSISIPFSISLATFVAVMISLILTCAGSSGEISYSIINITAYNKLSGSCIAGFFVAIGLSSISFIINVIEQGKSLLNKKAIISKAFALVSVVLILVALFYSIGKNFYFSYTEDGANISIYFSAYYDLTFTESIVLNTKSLLKLYRLSVHPVHFANLIISAVTIVSMVVSLGFVLNSLFKQTNYLGALISSLLSVVSSIVWIITSICCKIDIDLLFEKLINNNYLLESAVKFTTPGAIISLVLSLITLTLMITCKCLNKKKREI